MIKKNKIYFLLLCLLVLVTQTTLAAQKRLALVIGNSDYKDAPLKNPANDATDMAAKLSKLGFKVDKLINVDNRQMTRAIQRFGKSLQDKNTVGLFYFAGHGIQVDGVNYLLPLKTNIESEADIQFEAVNAARVLQQMELSENNLNLVILDACRNNPFARSFRSASRGLAKMEAPSGSMILYATSPGNVASDGEGRNGLFTDKLLKMMDKKGLKIEEVFKQTAIRVSESSGKKQYPYIEGFILGDFYFIESATIETDAVKAIHSTSDIADNQETVFWESVEASPSKEMYEAYLKEFPNGKFASLANIKISKYQSVTKHSKFSNRVSSPWIFPESGKRLLKDQELKSLSKERLWQARNEIFVRHGYIFKSSKGKLFAQTFGNSYVPKSSDAAFIYKNMSSTEQKNIQRIKSYE